MDRAAAQAPFPNGGAGVALLAPFDWTRFTLSARGIAVLESEVLWLGIPSLLVAAWECGLRRARAP